MEHLNMGNPATDDRQLVLRDFVEDVRERFDFIIFDCPPNIMIGSWAAMAGSWLALAWGFGGLRVQDGRPALAPQLPGAWRAYRFGLRWHDAQLRVEVDAGGVRYTLLEGEALDFLHRGQPLRLHKGGALQLPHPAVPTIRMKAASA